MVEAGGVELQKSIENTQVIENSRRTTRKKRGKSGSDVHGMYTKFGRTRCFVSCGMLGVVAFKSPFRSYLSRDERVRKNSAGVAIRSPVRFATACVKCLVLCVSNQSGLLDMAERSTGTSAACLIR